MTETRLQLNSAFTESRVLRVLVVPIGDNSQFDEQFRMVTNLHQVHLYNLNRASMKKPFMKYLNWNNGTMLFEFVRYDRTSLSSLDLNNFQSSRRIVMVLGLVNHTELTNPSKLDEELDQYTRRHGGVIFRSALVFNYPFDNPAVKGLLNKTNIFAAGGVTIFPPQGVAGEGRSIHDVHLEEVMGHEAVKIVIKFDEIMREMMQKVSEIVSISNLVSGNTVSIGPSSGMISSLLTPYDDVDSFNERDRELSNAAIGAATTATTAFYPNNSSPNPNPNQNNSSSIPSISMSVASTGKKKDFPRRKFPGRMKKWLGDMCMQVSSPLDALELYNLAVSECRSTNDDLWMAGALEGYCSALLLLHVSGYYTLDDVISTPGGKELKSIFEQYASNSEATIMTDRQKIVMLVEERIAEALSVYSKNVIYFNFECECLLRMARMYESLAEGCVGRQEKMLDFIQRAAAVRGLTNMQQAECLLEGAMLLRNPKLELPRKFGLLLVAAIAISINEGLISLPQALLKQCFAVYGIDVTVAANSNGDLSTLIAADGTDKAKSLIQSAGTDDADIFVAYPQKSWAAVSKMLFTLVAKISIASGDTTMASRSFSALLRLVSDTERRNLATFHTWTPTLTKMFEKRLGLGAQVATVSAMAIPDRQYVSPSRSSNHIYDPNPNPNPPPPSYAALVELMESSFSSGFGCRESLPRATLVETDVSVMRDVASVSSHRFNSNLSLNFFSDSHSQLDQLRKDPSVLFQLTDWHAYANERGKADDNKSISTVQARGMTTGQNLPDYALSLKTASSASQRNSFALNQPFSGSFSDKPNLARTSVSNIALPSTFNASPRNKEEMALNIEMESILSTFTASSARFPVQEEAMNQLYLYCRQLPFVTRMGLPIKFMCLRTMLCSTNGSLSPDADSDSPKLVKVTSKALKEALASRGESLVDSSSPGTPKSALFFDPFAAKRAKANEKSSNKKVAMWPRGWVGRVVVFVENSLSVPILLTNVSVNFEDNDDPEIYRLLSSMVVPVALEVPPSVDQFEIEIPVLIPLSSEIGSRLRIVPDELNITSVAFRIYNAEYVVPINDKGFALYSRQEVAKPWSFPRPMSKNAYFPRGKDVEQDPSQVHSATVVPLMSTRAKLSIDSNQVLVAPSTPVISLQSSSALDFKKARSKSAVQGGDDAVGPVVAPYVASIGRSKTAHAPGPLDADKFFGYNRHVAWSLCPGESKLERIYLLHGHSSLGEGSVGVCSSSSTLTSSNAASVSIYDYRITAKVWYDACPNPSGFSHVMLQNYKGMLSDSTFTGPTNADNLDIRKFITVLGSNFTETAHGSQPKDDKQSLFVDICFLDCAKFTRVAIHIETVFTNDPLLALTQHHIKSSSDVVTGNNSISNSPPVSALSGNRRDFLFGRVFSLAIDIKPSLILRLASLQQVPMSGMYINYADRSRTKLNQDVSRPKTSLDFLFSNLLSVSEFDFIKAALEENSQQHHPSNVRFKVKDAFVLKPIQYTQLFTLQVDNLGITDIELSIMSSTKEAGDSCPLRIVGLPFPRRLSPLSSSSVAFELNLASNKPATDAKESWDLIDKYLLKRLQWKLPSTSSATTLLTTTTTAVTMNSTTAPNIYASLDGERQGFIKRSKQDIQLLTKSLGLKHGDNSRTCHQVYPRFLSVSSVLESAAWGPDSGSIGGEDKKNPRFFRFQISDSMHAVIRTRISVNLKQAAAEMFKQRDALSPTTVKEKAELRRLHSKLVLDVAVVVVGGSGSSRAIDEELGVAWSGTDSNVAVSGQLRCRHFFSLDYHYSNYNGSRDGSGLDSEASGLPPIVEVESPVQLSFLSPGRYRIFTCSRLRDLDDLSDSTTTSMHRHNHHSRKYSDVSSESTLSLPDMPMKTQLVIICGGGEDNSSVSAMSTSSPWWVDPHPFELLVAS